MRADVDVMERSALAACLLDRGAAVEVMEVLRPEHLRQERHRVIYAAICGLVSGDAPVDTLTLGEALGDELARVGGYTYLTALANDLPTSENAREYALAVRRHCTRRTLKAAAARITALSDSEDVTAALEEAERLIYAVGDDSASRPVSLLGQVAWTHWDHLHQTRKQQEVLGLPTGFLDLTHALGGMQRGDLIILAGRPSMGKSALALQIAHAVAESGQPALFFSLEMSESSQAERMVCALEGLDLQLTRQRRLHDGQWDQAIARAADLGNLPLWVDDSGGISTLEMRAKARRLKARQGGLGLVVVDYLQLVGDRPDARWSKSDHVGQVCKRIKGMAHELDAAVLLLCQMNRGVEDRAGKVPMLRDLRDSGELEQDADVVLFVHRPEFYSPKDREGEADIYVAKHRNGPTGLVVLGFEGSFTRFRTLERRQGVVEGVGAC